MTKQLKNLIFILNIIGVFISIFSVQSIGILLILICIALNEELIISNLVVTPFYENVVVLYDGFSASKILYLFIIGLTVANLATRHYKKIILIDSLVIFILLLIFSTLNCIYAVSIGIIEEYAVLNSLLYYISRIVLLFLLVNFLGNRSDKYLKNSTNYLSWSLAFVIPFVFVYFQTNHVELNWYNAATRQVLVGTDPNELSVILISYFPFILINKEFNFFVKIFLIILAILLIFKLASRTSIILMAVFTVVLPFYLYKKTTSRFVYFLVLVVGIIFSFGLLIESNINLINRLLLSNDLNELTGNRFDLYIGSLKAIIDNPIFGYGANNYIASEINFQFSGIRLVSHNTILEFLMSFGILGVLSIIFLFINNKRYFKRQNTFTTNIYLMSLLILIFGSFTLSWLWREILWVIFAVYFSLNYKEYKQTLE